jgi:hypothetical protein
MGLALVVPAVPEDGLLLAAEDPDSGLGPVVLVVPVRRQLPWETAKVR